MRRSPPSRRGGRDFHSRDEEAFLFRGDAAAVNVALTPEELQHLEEVAPRGAASGSRYPEEMMRAVNR